ncbi:MAG: sigma-70 family RNA polymerase sigma factor [Muribaculaceae bacterium]|nr:sigma-70 family RNA polymerase sigma factor [Muribaculaceae bacterium]
MEKTYDILTASFLELRSRLHTIAIRMLLDDEDAKDALQDTYLKLRVRDETASESEARNKLVAVLRNVCIDRLRRRRTGPLDGSDVAEPSVEPYSEDISRLEHLLKTGLSPLQLKIYEMVTNREMEYDEVARETGMTIEAVRTNMSRTRKKIRENLKILNR